MAQQPERDKKMISKQVSEREKITIDSIKKNKLIAIIRGVCEHKLIKTAEALYHGGIELMEVTFNQCDPHCDEVISRQLTMLKDRFNDKLRLGAGTVMTAQQVDVASDAYADYIISPNTNVDIIRYTKAKGLVSIPGAFTASEIAAAHEAGADFVKLFPANMCGVEYIKAIKGPLPHINLLVVGGVDKSNIQSFLKAGCVGAGVGGKLLDKSLIDADKFDEIEAAARQLVESI